MATGKVERGQGIEGSLSNTRAKKWKHGVLFREKASQGASVSRVGVAGTVDLEKQQVPLYRCTNKISDECLPHAAVRRHLSNCIKLL